MTIGRKLEIGVGTLLALVVAIGMAWLGRLGGLDIGRQSAGEKTARRLQIAAEMDSAGSDMLAAMRGVVLFTAAGDPSQVAQSRQEFDGAAGRWLKSIAGLRPLLVQDDHRRLVDRMRDRLTAWRSVAAEVERAAARGDSDAALKIASTKGDPIYQANARDTARLREIRDGTPDSQRAGAASVSRADWWTDFGALVLAAGAGLLTLFFVRHTSRIAQCTWERTASPAETAAPAVEAGSPAETAAQAVAAGGAVGKAGEIAFRRDLLSLNAALEAARSGTAAKEPRVAGGGAANLVRRSAPAVTDTGPGAGTAG
jgi:hypothetical protein